MDLFIQLLISSFPILLLIAVWIYFIRRMANKGNPQERLIECYERNLVFQERIATALEKIAERK
jgi:ATP-dependent Zn protease